MKQFNSLAEFSFEKNGAPVFLCIGNFDGMHRGHRELFRLAKAAAREEAGICGALTFAPHPEIFFRGNDAVKLIYSAETKAELFMRAGADFTITQPFSAAFAGMKPDCFLPGLKEAIPSLSGIFVGANFRYGAKRGGDIEILKKSARTLGIRLCALPPILFEGEKISSTRIRKQIELGDIASVNAMLAEPYFSSGKIISGRSLGRTIGFPTLNCVQDSNLHPRFGVYVVRVRQTGENESFRGIANFGVRPTIESGSVPDPLLEVHLLDVPEGKKVPTYGDGIRVEWLNFLRSEQRFDSVEALRKRLIEDRRQALAFFEAHACADSGSV